MSNKYFIDTNVIIDLLNSNDNLYVQKLKQLMITDNVELCINNLVVAEALQGIKLQATRQYTKYKKFLIDSFIVISVDNQIIYDSIEIYRLCKSQGVNFNNENICPVDNCNRVLFNSIDCIHYATCVKYELKMLTSDRLFKQIDTVKNFQIIDTVIN